MNFLGLCSTQTTAKCSLTEQLLIVENAKSEVREQVEN